MRIIRLITLLITVAITGYLFYALYKNFFEIPEAPVSGWAVTIYPMQEAATAILVLLPLNMYLWLKRLGE